MTIFRRMKLRKAYEKRDAADQRLRNAVWRRDTRAEHHARRALQQATLECLRLEVR